MNEVKLRGMKVSARLHSGIENYVPEHMRDTVRLYVEQRIEPGSFMVALLSNDLIESFARADDINAKAMERWVVFLYSFMPQSLWGSREVVEEWLSGGAS